MRSVELRRASFYPCDLHQFLQAEQRSKDRPDLLNGTLVSRVCMAEDVDQNRLIHEFYEPISITLTQGRRARAHYTSSVKARSPRETAALASERKVVRKNAERGPYSSSALEENALKER